MRISLGIFSVFSIALAGCGYLPTLPPDTDLPIREILLNASCELQSSLRYLDNSHFVRFKARQWLVTVTLLPRVDTDVSAGIGFSGKSGNHSFVIGSGTGLGGDVKGARSSGVAYNMKSRELISSKTLPCDNPTPTFNALSQNLRVGEWLIRAASAMDLNPVAEIDKPTFNSQITIKFSGDGSYSYLFPVGTPSASFAGSYAVDEQLQISLLPLDPPPTHYNVRTLPVNGLKSLGIANSATLTSVQQAQRRSDTIQLDTTLRNLRILQ
jgi:hypothetical protein